MEAEQHVAQAPAPSVASQPDAKPIDSSAAGPSTSKPKASASASTVGALLRSTNSTVDAFLGRLLRCLETRAGADTVLFLLCYASRLAAAVLDGAGRAALRHSSQRLVALAAKLPPEATVTLSGPLGATPAAALASAAVRLAARLKTFSGLLTDIRTFGRLWGLLGMYFGAKRFLASRLAASKDSNAGEKNGQQDFASSALGATFTAVKLATIIFFQATENITYLASKNVIGLAPATAGTVARWSVRAFMYYVHIEVARGLIERAVRVSAAREQGLSAAQQDPVWDASWKRDFFRNLAWSPLTLHWATDLPAPLKLNELAISALGLYPACGQMRDLWRASA